MEHPRRREKAGRMGAGREGGRRQGDPPPIFLQEGGGKGRQGWDGGDVGVECWHVWRRDGLVWSGVRRHGLGRLGVGSWSGVGEAMRIGTRPQESEQ